MELHTYPLLKNEDLKSYYFWSFGPNGAIKKVIIFQLIDRGELYNLAFGDLHPDTEIIDDLAVTNNGDMKMVLATVGKAVTEFFEDFPNATLIAAGSTIARTRLYQINISRFMDEIFLKFVVKGYQNGAWESFQRGVNYNAFMIARKELSLI